MASLGVNIDHIATVREARGGTEPDVVEAGQIAEKAGADAITIHLREDRRHIQDEDVVALKSSVAGRLNLEMAATVEMIAIAKTIQPDCCCIVPEKREELTTEGGLDVISNKTQVTSLINTLHDHGITVSLFIDPDLRQIECARACGAKVVESHTGKYANTRDEAHRTELERVARAVAFSIDCGMQANAGHGLNYSNTREVAMIPGVAELNIGHSIVSRALSVGMFEAVKEMKAIIGEAT